MNTHHYLVGALAVFEASEDDKNYCWKDFQEWAISYVEETDAFSLVGSEFMRLHCPPLITHILKEPSLHSAYKANHGAALKALSKHLCEGVSLSKTDSGFRTKTGKKSRWTPKDIGELYVESLFESWGLNALYRAFELCSIVLLSANLPKKTNRDYIELAVGLLLLKDFNHYLAQK
jgi:hypothetical protein